MRVEYINPFVESAVSVLKENLQAEVKHGKIFLKPPSASIMGVAAMVGLAGDVEGRVLFDMSKETALNIGIAMTRELGEDDRVTVFNDYAKEVIQEVANQITGQAVTKLHDAGFKFDLTPPALFTGENMEVATHLKVEVLVVPLELGDFGQLEVNVAIRERVK